ncbi:hypothetical protein R5R35_011803 [Gryllus longicercus]|uniref:DNA-directed RNA polymerase III subunit RPC3 n=1 Tax=Gryllus longicercus TaxID=2509291 RepID=A0AAN9W8C1_9ORTH
MSVDCGILCSKIILEHFGGVVKTVAHDLFKVSSKTLSNIVATTKLQRSQVIECLRILVRYGLVTYKVSLQNPKIPEYSLSYEKVLLFPRYVRYMLLVKTLYGDEAELLIEELLRSGSEKASSIIVRATTRLKEIKKEEKNVSLNIVRDKLILLMNKQFVMRCPEPLPGCKEIPQLIIKQEDLFMSPSLSLKELTQMEEGHPEVPANDVTLRVNFDRFHQEFRDNIMISAIKRRIDDNAGELMRVILQQMYIRTEAWEPISNPIPVVEIRNAVHKVKTNPRLAQHLDQYLKVLDEDSSNFITKVADSGGGQYVVNIREAFIQLSWAAVENIVEERFGSKAARVFRLIKSKHFIEQEQIQQYALIPAKEAKLITYRLLEECFIQIQELRKSMSSAGPNKTFFLFHIDIDQVVKKCLEICYKALTNSMVRRQHERDEHKRLIEKQQRIESLTANLREQGAPADQIDELEELLTPLENEALERVRIMIARLGEAELRVDDNMFLLQLYLMYSNCK